jgi:hypothetical protein
MEDEYNYMFSRFENGKIITTNVGVMIPSNADDSFTFGGIKYDANLANSFMQPKSFTENETYDIDYYDSANNRKTIKLNYSGITSEGHYEFKFVINPLKIENIYLVNKKMGGKYTKQNKKINKKINKKTKRRLIK